MSTILKSLKKLEQEKEASRYAVHAGPGTVVASGGSSRWTKITWIRRSIVALLILGLGATSLYFYRQTQGQSATASVSQQTIQPPAKEMAKRTIQKKMAPQSTQADPRSIAKPQNEQPQKIQSQDRSQAVTPKSEPSPMNRQGEPAQPVVSPNQRPTPTPEPMSATEPELTPAERPTRPAGPPQDRRQVSPSQQRKPLPAVAASAKVKEPVRPTPQQSTQPLDAYNSVRTLTDGRLKIQAIVWSDIKQDRMAVINTQILHEGDVVSGFSVVAIRPDDVVVRGEGGGLHKVIFGRP